VVKVLLLQRAQRGDGGFRFGGGFEAEHDLKMWITRDEGS
jgi:hypothetical protein